MTTKLLPYKMGSASARALADAMNIKMIKHANSKWVGRGVQRDKLINWGCNNPDLLPRGSYRIINHPSTVARATNKLEFFQFLSFHASEEIRSALPNWTQDQSVARQWIEEGATVVCRTLLRANSGRGIVIASTAEQLVRAPLYVKYVKKQDEFRVHVANGTVFDTQRKMRNQSVPDDNVNWQIRNHDNGFIFGREGVEPSEERNTLAEGIAVALGLDFCAVDVIYNAHHNKYYVLEVNTAPGLTGTTLQNYTDVLLEI